MAFTPILQALLSTVACGSTAEVGGLWRAQGLVCFAGGHIGLVAASLLLAAAFVAAAGLYALVAVDSHPLSPSPRGASSGRAALLMIIWKVRVVGGG